MPNPHDRRHALGFALIAALGIGCALWLSRAPAPVVAEAAAPTAPTPPTPLSALVESLRAEEGGPFHDVALEHPEALARLTRALAATEAGEGVARIVVYGGSHTAGDLFTGRLREILQARYGDAGHGFVPIVPVVDRHWAWGVRIHEAEGFEVLQVGFKRREIARYGLAGAAFLASEPEAFAAVQADHWGNGRYASRLSLLFDRVPNGGRFDVSVDGVVRETVEARSDPPAGATLSYDVSDGPHLLEVRTRGDGDVVLFGAVMDRDGPGVIVDNLGLTGSKARHQLLWDEALWREYFVARAPDLVVLAYGNNETTDTHLTIAQHEAHLREVLDRIARATPGAGCLLIGPTDRARVRDDGALEPRPVVTELTEMQRAVAADRGCAFFDTLAFQGGLGASLEWLEREPPLMRDDRQHLSRPAYLAWGRAIARAILAAVLDG